MPQISVIMNCYNGQRFLREAIDSVYAQTRDDWEIVFWDNASTDRSAEIALSYADGRLRYFRSESTVPLGAARARAIVEARGEYIAFLDCDDLWVPETLELQVGELERFGYPICYAGVVEVDASGREIGRQMPTHSSGQLFEALLNQFEIWVPAVVLRKQILAEAGITFDGGVTASEEYCLFMQLAVTYPIAVLHEAVARYRIHEQSLTNHSIGRWAEEREYTLELIRKHHPGIRDRYGAAFDEAYARAAYYRARYLLTLGEKRKALRELRRAAFVDARYFALFVLALLPTRLWDMVHERRFKRVNFSQA